MLKEKVIAIINQIDDQDILMFILVILEDSLQWQQVSNLSA